MPLDETFKEIAEQFDEEVIALDGLDEAIIGIAEIHTLPVRLAYSYDKIIEILMRDSGSYEEAVEFFDVNIASLWAGDGTPTIVHRLDQYGT